MTMNWTPESIITLRRKLGWTRAELSRRVGVTVQVIQAWEDGTEKPDSEAGNQLLSLDGHLQKYSQSLATDPLAELFLEKNKLNQILKNELRIQD